MKAVDHLLEHRRRYLRAKIAEQRLQLGVQLSAVQGPLHALEIVRGIAQKLRRHSPVLLVAACLCLGAMRGGLLSKALRVVRFANTAARWWAIGGTVLPLVLPFRDSPARVRPFEKDEK